MTFSHANAGSRGGSERVSIRPRFQRALHRLASSAGAELAIDGLRLAPDGMHGDDELFTDLAKRVMRR